MWPGKIRWKPRFAAKKTPRKGRFLEKPGLGLQQGLLAPHPVFATEFIHAPTGVKNLLLAGVKGVALRTNFDMQLFAQGGAGDEVIAATANNLDFFVFRVDIRFHELARPASACKKGAKCNFYLNI
jgi:hypothetical protein